MKIVLTSLISREPNLNSEVINSLKEKIDKERKRKILGKYNSRLFRKNT